MSDYRKDPYRAMLLRLLKRVEPKFGAVVELYRADIEKLDRRVIAHSAHNDGFGKGYASAKRELQADVSKCLERCAELEAKWGRNEATRDSSTTTTGPPSAG